MLTNLVRQVRWITVASSTGSAIREVICSEKIEKQILRFAQNDKF